MRIEARRLGRPLTVLVALIAGSAPFQPAEGQSPRTLGPVAFSMSGGTSKGAYQAGVLYGLFRELHPGNTAGPAALAPGHPVAFTGASAGNINAVLGALEWCRTRPSTADESLFYQVWRSVGLQQLLGESIEDYAVHQRRPDGAGDELRDQGVFTRAFFRDSLIPMIEARYGTTPVRPDCVSPIGLLLNRRTPTNLVPNPFPGRLRAEGRAPGALDDRGCPAPWTFQDIPGGEIDPARDRRTRVPNTRFVALLGAGVEDGRLMLTSFPFATKDGRAALPSPDLGAWLTPVVDPAEPRRALPLGVTEAFDFVLASSAFPVAFAPVPLRFHVPAHQQDAPSCDGLLCPDEAEFWDGGTFDNAPVLVAHRLGCVSRSLAEEGSPTPTSTAPAAPEDSVWVMSATMNVRRGPGDRVEVVDDPPPVGLAQIAEVASEFVSAARAYELQATSRFAPDVIDQTISSSRRMPIFGERLHSFGAFLSPAFRDIDFHVGVFEGARTALLERLCVNADSPGDCLAAELASARDRLGMGPCGQVVFDVVLAEEFSEAPEPAAIREAAAVCTSLGGLGPGASPVVLTAGLVHLLENPDPPCLDRSGSLRVLCRAGFLEFRETVLELDPDPDLSGDEILARLVDDPGGLADRLTVIGLDRAWRVADWSDSGGPAERTVNALQVVYEATGGRVVEGFEVAPGLFPRTESRLLDRSVKLMPSFVRAAWEPGLAGPGLDLVYVARVGVPDAPRLGLDLRPRLVAHRDASPRLKAGVGLTLVLDPVEVAGGWERDVDGRRTDTWYLGVRGPMDVLSLELREGGRWSFGIADAPGIAYWLLRLPG